MIPLRRGLNRSPNCRGLPFFSAILSLLVATPFFPPASLHLSLPLSLFSPFSISRPVISAAPDRFSGSAVESSPPRKPRSELAPRKREREAGLLALTYPMGTLLSGNRRRRADGEEQRTKGVFKRRGQKEKRKRRRNQGGKVNKEKSAERNCTPAANGAEKFRGRRARKRASEQPV